MRHSHARRAGGFTYVSLIIMVAIIGLVAAASLKLGATVQRSRAEQQLLVIGAAFSDALQSYADATPAGQPPQPPSLKDLLRDPRFPTPRRHLRKIFVDPMTGKAEWGIVYLGGTTGVMAVYSLSQARPVKIGNFPARFQSLAGKQKISEWRFVASGPGTPGTQGANTGAAPPDGTSALAPGAQSQQALPMPGAEPRPQPAPGPNSQPEPGPGPGPEPGPETQPVEPPAEAEPEPEPEPDPTPEPVPAPSSMQAPRRAAAPQT
ncbi:type II secretory pathway pseudopilin PulG [Duganella sp. 3397]|uniref:type II secretion system protein n=1 Tax=Duganella sp. 3397 TaxID=2817732 RepID=UPI0028626347|nr:type II secretion system protein [Duganella sp. 3397]MDR7052125.1 type II secretory pathway pseudopilin PulG [Duganella sp. 3397]